MRQGPVTIQMNDNSGFEKSDLWERSFQTVTGKSSLRQGNIIYRNLPYDVRQVEARKFSSGEIDALVATGAIGLGLNLPIKRIMFLETTKYDGVTRRFLRVDEAKQIAGRAGQAWDLWGGISPSHRWLAWQMPLRQGSSTPGSGFLSPWWGFRGASLKCLCWFSAGP